MQKINFQSLLGILLMHCRHSVNTDFSLKINLKNELQMIKIKTKMLCKCSSFSDYDGIQSKNNNNSCAL